MAEPFIGELKLVPYNFAPRGWAFCQGQILSIAQNTALFSLLGTTYGGNGTTTFALPDLQGRCVVGRGQGPGLSDVVLGEEDGVETVTLLLNQMPAHNHSFAVQSANATLGTSSLNVPATATGSVGSVYGTAAGGTMPPTTIQPAGSTQPHDNRQAYLTLNYVIALEGIFPQRS